MASFKYKVTVQEPNRGGQDSGGWCEWTPKPIESDCGDARSAQMLARAQHRRPDSTTITIQRMRARPDPITRRQEPFDHAVWLPYRRYVVQDGVVKRVDR